MEIVVGGWLERYRIRDSATTDPLNYVPGSFFLAPNDSDYHGNVAYVRAIDHW